jgi:tetratricopeptide (TPR) repeat protein
MKSILSRLFGPATGNPTPAVDPAADEIARARALHEQGHIDAAAALYRRILDAHPGSAEGHYRYGNLLADLGQWEAALGCYDRAVASRHDHAHAHCNRAVVLGRLDRIPEALESYRRALAIDPGDVVARCNLGTLLSGLGRKSEALACFDAAVVHDARCFAGHFGKGALLQENKEWRGALAAYDLALGIQPGDPLTHYNRGTVLRQLEQWDAALASFSRAIELDASFFRAHAAQGDMLAALNRFEAAVASYARAIALQPEDVTLHTNCGVLQHKLQNFSAALASYDRALALRPEHAEAHFNRGCVLGELDDWAAALACYERAIAAQPRYQQAYVNRGSTLLSLGRIRDAIASFRQAIEIDPELAEAHYNLALAALTAADFQTGWQEYEWRWRAQSGAIYREKREFAAPLWTGRQPLAGTAVLLYAEQGLGDALQFCRYAPEVAALGARVILEVPAPLVDLCSTLPGVAQVLPYGGALPGFDYQCPLMSLPLAFHTELETIPSPAGYLRADEHRTVGWQRRLAPRSRPRIGLTWSGKRVAGTDPRRHFPLSSLLPHLPDEFDYVCLQTEVLAADRDTLTQCPAIRRYELSDFSDTAALCECVDLVISVDTSVAHLAGALGRPVWVLLAFSADWRWLTDREDSPWYRSVRLFRQSSPGDWNSVFQRVERALRSHSWSASAGPVMEPR